MSKLRFVGLGLLLLSACGPTLAEDFDSFCRVSNEVNKDGNLATEEKLAKIAGRSAEYMQSPESKAADNIWQKVNNAPNDKKYAVLTEAGRAAKPDWKCNSYEKILVELAAKQKMAEEKLKAAEAAQQKAAAAEAEKPKEEPVAEKKTKKSKKKKKKKKDR